jgi:hypothetical protein
MTIIIPIGSCCEITFKLEKLKSKGETSLFEWHFSFNFKDVLKVFKTISNGEELTYSYKSNNSYIDNVDIYSSHYRKIDEYADMMNRRKERLVNQIKGDVSLPNLRLRQAKVVTVNVSPASLDVQIAGGANTLPSVKYLSSYSPTQNDTVCLISFGADLLVIGKQA